MLRGTGSRYSFRLAVHIALLRTFIIVLHHPYLYSSAQVGLAFQPAVFLNRPRKRLISAYGFKYHGGGYMSVSAIILIEDQTTIFQPAGI
jgi:hypothetical protein